MGAYRAVLSDAWQRFRTVTGRRNAAAYPMRRAKTMQDRVLFSLNRVFFHLRDCVHVLQIDTDRFIDRDAS